MARSIQRTSAPGLLLLLSLSATCALRLGGIERASVGDQRVQEVADYAVAQLNERGESANGGLQLSRIVSVRKQLVAGTLYFVNLEVTEGDSDEARTFEVAVYEPFGAHTNTLKLTHYKEAGKASKHAAADSTQAAALLAPSGSAEQVVEVSDELAEGAAYAVAQLTQQSNSLIPWTLKEVVDARHLGGSLYQLSLRVVRGQEEKVFQVKLRQAADDWLVQGSFVAVSA
eukprot:jgi/Tetstr1/429268/TSEL_019186.t1